MTEPRPVCAHTSPPTAPRLCPKGNTGPEQERGWLEPASRPPALTWGGLGWRLWVILGLWFLEARNACAREHALGRAPPPPLQRVLADACVLVSVSEGSLAGGSSHQPAELAGPTHFIFSARCSVFSRMAWDSWDTGFSIRLSKITCEDRVSAQRPPEGPAPG